MTEQNNTETQNEVSFDIQRIYTKDISFETPNSPTIFNEQWSPAIEMEMNSATTSIAENLYEVALRITLTAKIEEKVAFLCEVTQAGIFAINGMDEQQMAHCLGAYCPNILFPYARECISGLVTRGTFQPINLAPVNFDALFMNYMQQQAAQEQEQEGPLN